MACYGCQGCLRTASGSELPCFCRARQKARRPPRNGAAAQVAAACSCQRGQALPHQLEGTTHPWPAPMRTSAPAAISCFATSACPPATASPRGVRPRLFRRPGFAPPASSSDTPAAQPRLAGRESGGFRQLVAGVSEVAAAAGPAARSLPKLQPSCNRPRGRPPPHLAARCSGVSSSASFPSSHALLEARKRTTWMGTGVGCRVRSKPA